MIKIVFPSPTFQIKEEDEKEFIFDAIRKQWVRLTPEEWVRQNLLQYFIQTKQYPAAYIGVEKEIKLGELKKRFDLLLYNREHQPWMLVECKAMDVELTENVLEQLIRYHLTIPVPYLVISNGVYTYAWSKNESRLISLTELPAFE